ncbi:MAG: IS21 family transposase [Sedimentisphaerales bacterium]|nr:IS21 family transposase [Sedimentisphaerales bacterium]
MANRISMVKANDIVTLCKYGFSQREVARKLAIHRHTVSRYVQLAREGAKSTIVPLGSEEGTPAKSTISPPGSGGRISQCQPYATVIQKKLDQGFSGQRIYQDLVTEEDFTGSYDSVKRFIRRLGPSSELPFRRWESLPGQEGQIDFGKGAAILTPEGKRWNSYVFRIVLSHSRKGYSEAVLHQSTESFLRCLENAFWYFGGVPQTLVIDNLKAAVSKADWYDPELHPKIQSFCQHYGTVILPTKPYTPRHKGKIESGIGYVKDNALKGRTFATLQEQNQFLQNWERHTADTRIHGTTRQQVAKVFEEQEKSVLLPLPISHFASFREARRSVHRDGYVEVDKSYYSVPPEYLGRQVWVRWDSRLVRIFNSRMEPIAVHAKVEPGRFQTRPDHIHERKRSGIERGAGWLLQKASRIGSGAQQWAQAMLQARGVEGMRVLMGLISLPKQYSPEQINHACRIALSYEAFRLRTIREIIKRGGQEQPSFAFIEEHPIIRHLSDYQRFIENDPDE